MKAAVIYPESGAAKYIDIPAPEATKNDEVLVQVRAVAMKHFDRSQASGGHYSAKDTGQPKVIGSDGVGILPDGSRIYGIGLKGTMAEQALFRREWCAAVPDDLDDAVAAALPNAVMGSAMALHFRAKLKYGETVLINGATGFTGRVAVQLARHYGAGKIIVTGRDDAALKSLLDLGADEAISLQDTDEQFMERLKTIHSVTPIEVVLDYLWGKPAELILSTLKGKGTFSASTRYVSIGSTAGDNIQLSSEILRSINIQLSGSGIGSWTREQVGLLFSQILPEAFQLAVAGNLSLDLRRVRFAEIEQLWDLDLNKAERPVVVIGADF